MPLNTVKLSMKLLFPESQRLLHVADFAASNPVPSLNDGTLQMAFVDLRQVRIQTVLSQA